MKTLFALVACTFLLTGCAAVGNNACSGVTSTLVVTPAVGTADHSAVAPGNQVQFTAVTHTTYPAGCAVPTVIAAPYQTNWTSSNPVIAPIDSTFGAATNGVATCVSATDNPVTVTAGALPGTAGLSATATLVCK